MAQEVHNPQINISNIAVGGGIAGAFVTIVSMAIFLMGIPMLRYVFPAALVLGLIVAVVLRFRKPKPVGTDWILPAIRK